jgi:hypothetical protein
MVYKMKYHPGCSTGNSYLDEALENYLIHGFEPGGFMTSVLANDLHLAIGRADNWNQDRMPEILRAVLKCAPEAALGSYKRVKDWCADKNGLRSAYAMRKDKEYVLRILKGEANEESVFPPF